MTDIPGGSTEFIGLREACARYPLAYSSIRNWIHSGLLPAWRTPNGRTWVKPADIEANLFRRIVPTNPTPPEGS